MQSRPRSAVATRPGPTSSPPSRKTRPKTTTCLTTACGVRSVTGRGDERRERVIAEREQILVVLEQRAERRGDMLHVELSLPERGQRAHPVDRLGDPGRLLQVEGTQLGGEARGLL